MDIEQKVIARDIILKFVQCKTKEEAFKTGKLTEAQWLHTMAVIKNSMIDPPSEERKMKIIALGTLMLEAMDAEDRISN